MQINWFYNLLLSLVKYLEGTWLYHNLHNSNEKKAKAWWIFGRCCNELLSNISYSWRVCYFAFGSSVCGCVMMYIQCHSLQLFLFSFLHSQPIQSSSSSPHLSNSLPIGKGDYFAHFAHCVTHLNLQQTFISAVCSGSHGHTYLALSRTERLTRKKNNNKTGLLKYFS